MENTYEFDENGNNDNTTTRKKRGIFFLIFLIGIISFQILILFYLKNNIPYNNILSGSDSSNNTQNNLTNNTNYDDNINNNTNNNNTNNNNDNNNNDNNNNDNNNNNNNDNNNNNNNYDDINQSNITINNEEDIDDELNKNENYSNNEDININNRRIINISQIDNKINPKNIPREYIHDIITNITLKTNHSDPSLLLKVAFISDSHIDPDNPLKFPFEKNLLQSLKNIKSKNVDIIIFGGDLCDVCSVKAFNKFKEIYESVYPNDDEGNPILLLTMGNHDYYPSKENNYSNYEAQDLFQQIFKVKHQNHTIINNFHFILWGNQHMDFDYAYLNTLWIQEEIDNVLLNQNSTFKNSQINPMFIITHFPPRNTSFRSEFWGSFDIINVLSRYPHIINLCSHSHATLFDENSINQKFFTVINSQAISRVTVDFAENNYDVPTDEYGNDEYSYKNYMGNIIEIRNNKINIKRMYLDDGTFYEKEWNILLPILQENFIYDDRRMLYVKKPYFEKNKKKYIEIIKKIINGTERFLMKFEQAKHENFVYGYNISFVKYNFLGKQNIINQEILKSKYAIYDGFQGLIKESYVYQNKNKDYIGIRNFTYFYISDFFLKPKDRKQYITLLINDELEKGKYNVTIVAFASYKIMSEDNITEEISLE